MQEGPFWNGDVQSCNAYSARGGPPQLFAWGKEKGGSGVLPGPSRRHSNTVVFQEARGPAGARNHWFATKDGTVQGCFAPCRDGMPPGLLDGFYAFATSQAALLCGEGGARAEEILRGFNDNARALVEQEEIIQGCVQGYEASCCLPRARPWGEDFYSCTVQAGAGKDPAGGTLEVALRVAHALCCRKGLRNVARVAPPTQETCRAWTAWAEATGSDKNGDEVCFRVGVTRQKRAPQSARILVVDSDSMWGCVANHPLPRTPAGGWTAHQFDGKLCAESIAKCLAEGCSFEAYGGCPGDARKLTEGVVRFMGGVGEDVREVSTAGVCICTGALELRAGTGEGPTDDLIVQSVEARAGTRQCVSLRVASGGRNALWKSFCRAAARHDEARRCPTQRGG